MSPISSAWMILTVTTLVLSASTNPHKYSNKYDHVDINSILRNDRVLQSHINCILEKGSCTQEGKDFRDYLPEAIATSCEKCTEAQKQIVKKAAKYLMENRNSDWEEIRRKYDPKKEHIEEFNRFMESP